MFSFSVSCKDVGFMIYKLKSFSCKAFAIYFFLWSGGGPNWKKELELWNREQEAEWTVVGSKPSKDIAKPPKASLNFRKSFADAVRFPPGSKETNILEVKLS